MRAYLRTKPKGKSYYCELRWQENGKQRIKEISTKIPVKGNNLRKAETKCEELRREYERKYDRRNSNSVNVLFSDYITEWLQHRKQYVESTTYSGYKSIVEKYIEPYFKERGIRLCDLDTLSLQRYYDSLMELGISGQTIRRHHTLIKHSLKQAVRYNLIPQNPAEGVELPKAVKYHARVYNEHEIELLIEKTKNSPLETIVLLGVVYGLRRSEIAGLTWSNIDLENRIIKIHKTRVDTKEVEILRNKAKTDSSYRELPIDDTMMKYFLNLKEKRDNNRRFLGRQYSDTDFVCCWEDGSPYRVNYMSDAFRRFLAKNKLPHIRLHDLRHSCATLALKNGKNVNNVQDYLRHSSITVTANLYLHPDMEEKKKALESITGIFRI